MWQVTREVVGAVAREQLIEHQAQRVHVRGCGNGLAAELFGTGVFGCHHPQAGGHGHHFRERTRIEKFGDAKIQQLGGAFGGDQNVAGFNVAVDHQALVSIVNCGAYSAEDSQPLIDGEFMVIAIRGDSQAVD